MKKFSDAFNGLVVALSHKSVLLQLLLGIIAIIGSMIFHFTKSEMIIVAICIGLVIASEIFNTCIERVCDEITMDKKDSIKRIKDMSAAAVLVVCIMSLVVGILILMNHI